MAPKITIVGPLSNRSEPTPISGQGERSAKEHSSWTPGYFVLFFCQVTTVKRKIDNPGTSQPRSGRVIGRVTLLSLLLVLARPADAHAYIDPSTTSYFLQWLLAAILGAAFAIRIFWRNLKAFFTRRFSGRADSRADSDD